MGSFKLSLLRILLIPSLLVASIVAEELKAGDGVLRTFIDLTAGDDELHTFIVHVQPTDNHVFGTADDRTAWYQSFLPEDGRLIHAYHHVASGFAARLTRRELDAMSAAPGFLRAQPNEVYQLLTTHTPRFLGLDVPQDASASNSSALGFGDGVIIGVPDSGVYPYHPSYSGDGMPPPPARWKGRCDFDGSACNNKLIGAQSFESNPLPLDHTGHGTHTSSTAAGALVPDAQVLGQGRGTASGIAPRAHVAIYKVCGEECTGADILAGIDTAVGDGCDVLSISIAGGGPEVPYYENPLTIGTFGAVEKGVFVSIGAGNSGPSTSSLYNDAPWQLSVAASTVDRLIGAQVRLGNGLSFDGESVYQPNISAAFYPLVYAGASSRYHAEFCGKGSLDGLDVEGKIVLCYRGGGSGRVAKGTEVKRAGGVGMIMANGASHGYSTLADAHDLPASHVSYAAGEAIKKYISSTANPVAKIVFQGTVLGTKPAPAMASFSSRGPSLRVPGILKPDITGPGVSILAAWPVQVGPSSAAASSGPTFNFDSGTSMATPHLSGIAALVKNKHPDWSPAVIKSAIMTTADPNDRSGNPIVDEQHQPASFFLTGAGHVNPDKAVDPGLVYDISTADYVGHLCSIYASRDVSVIARRAVDCSAVKVIKDNELNYPSISASFPPASSSKTVVEVNRTARNVGKAPAVYYPYVDSFPSGVVHVTPSSLQFTKVNQERSFTVRVSRGKSGTGTVVQGALRWVSDEHTVRSPISITF
ncbi:Subtilisin-like protease SBT1.7 [Dichanthelium oligosanthes]|uniref:Subtilisin-like protease SBT1.7 n=1 Tax=Dichanthelium oligosanthes TaxID=888268 RepID=A0A1E5UL67_9POAL|nr:Subtilisin-like protease SBT1.7 [Dichanthelium oligosanthes]